MSALRLIEAAEAPLLARPFYVGGDPGPLVGALAHVPEMLEVAMPFLGAVLGPSSIPARTKELVVLRTSAVAECSYCVAAHTGVALDTGLERDEIVALRGEAPLPGAFASPADLALLAWVDAVAGAGPVPAAVGDGLRLHYPEHEVVELTLLVGATLMLNRFCTSLGLPVSAELAGRLEREGLR